MRQNRSCGWLLMVMAGVLWLGGPGTVNQVRAQGRRGDTLVPPVEMPGGSVRRALDAPFLNAEELKELRVFHGIWLVRDLDTPARRAQAALLEYRWSSAALQAPSASIEARGEAMVQRGEMQEAVALLQSADSMRGQRLRAEALEWLGQFEAADAVLGNALGALDRNELTSADDLTEAARCMIIRARLRGETAGYYHRILAVLGRVEQQIDRLYWPAKLVAAELLLEKDNFGEAVEILQEVVGLNPRCSKAWFQLGLVALRGYDFNSSEEAAIRLTNINPQHPLAMQLRARSALVQHLADEAEEELAPLLADWPKQREALALWATAAAARFDQVEISERVADFDLISPGHPYAYYLVGMQLANDRQYEWSADALNEAIRRQPNWAAPQIELGLMEMQAGRDAQALRALRRVSELDPFNVRAAFSLHLIEGLVNYAVVESEHFLIRFDPESSDRALAVEMGPLLDLMYTEVTAAFGYEPAQKTVIELLPNHERFAVRITGMPELHTIAASTGPVIALESPRVGPGHFGIYDWLRVLRHEFVHTVTLGQTENRIPHWLTEAAAVWQELAPRAYDICIALARAEAADELFDLDEINWAFVRPKRQGDRSLAYAQAHWMFEFLIERYGHRRMTELLAAYRRGLTAAAALQEVTGVSQEEFFAEFRVWAKAELETWGLRNEPAIEDLLDELAHREPAFGELIAAQTKVNTTLMNEAVVRLLTVPREVLDELEVEAKMDRFNGAGEKETAEKSTPRNAWPDTGLYPELEKIRIPTGALRLKDIRGWLELYPGHADVLWLRVQRLENELMPEVVEAYQRYREARPVDPLPLRRLADLYLRSGDEVGRAIPYLEELDRLEQSTGALAIELARLYRQQGNFKRALSRARRALVLEPFNANYRELAATLALQAGDFVEARRQLEALQLIEPDRAQHAARLKALDRLQKRDGN